MKRMRWRRKAKLPTAIDFLIDPPENIKNYGDGGLTQEL